MYRPCEDSFQCAFSATFCRTGLCIWNSGDPFLTGDLSGNYHASLTIAELLKFNK